jgi:lysozyme
MPQNPWMVYSDTGLSLTERAEALRLTAYQDQGKVWTIGFGHTMGVYEGMVITYDQAVEFLRMDIAHASATVNTYVNVPITQNQFDSLVDFTFNVGGTAFSSSHLLGAINAQDWVTAEEQFSRWVFVKGTVNAGLQNRRNAELKEFEG